jgi:ABC-type phosphate transport system substrate-binding protein
MRAPRPRPRLATWTLAIAGAFPAAASAGVVVIGHADVARLDAQTLEKIFTGRVISVDGVPVVAVNVSRGSALRKQFLESFLKQDDDQYTAYWTVRRYVGKGAPPREFSNVSDLINFVKSTPGAVGYVEEADVPAGVVVLLK